MTAFRSRSACCAEDEAHRLGWGAADAGAPRVAEHDDELFALYTDRASLGQSRLRRAWLAGCDARVLPEQTPIGERSLARTM